MRRIVMWFLSTVTVVVLLFGYHTSSPSSAGAGGTIVASSSAEPGATASSGSSGSSGSTGTRTATGSVAQTEWGPVQVQVTLDGTTITDVQVLQYPNGNPKDQQINAYALPVLVQETKEAQSADIDMVSGATVTSQGYLQSLQAALDEAGL